jgi:hypothetical protein
MSHQVEPGTVGSVEPGAVGGAAAGARPAGFGEQAAFVPQVPGTPVSYPPPFHGRAVSWVAVSIVMAGFAAGGLGLVFGPSWVAFWVGVGMAVVGGLLALATNIFEDWY